MIYLDNAATTFPKPKQVGAAMRGYVDKLGANPGRAGHDPSVRAGALVEATRSLAASFFNLDDSRGVIFCQNCTDALNLAIKGSVQPGMHVVTTMLEHNSVLRVVKTLERRGVITLSIVAPSSDGTVRPEHLVKAVTARTGLVILTHASNVLGRFNDVETVGAYCRRRGIRFLVDAAQSAGAAAINLAAQKIDLLACAGHKGLYGPQGTGLLCIRSGLALTPLREGGTGTESARMTQPDEWPERFESGTLNAPGIAGLFAGLRYVTKNRAQILSHEQNLAMLLTRELSHMNGVTVYPPTQGAPQAGVVSFNIGDLPSGQVADLLSDRGFAVRAGLHCAPLVHAYLGTTQRGAVRASFGAFNTPSELDAFCAAVSEISRCCQ